MCKFQKHFFNFKKIFYLFTSREKRREGEREGEKHQCVRDVLIGCLSHAPEWGPGPTTQVSALNGAGRGNPWVHRLALSPLSHTSQGSKTFF